MVRGTVFMRDGWARCGGLVKKWPPIQGGSGSKSALKSTQGARFRDTVQVSNLRARTGGSDPLAAQVNPAC